MLALLRSLLWTDPLILVLTMLMGTLSLIASVFDGTGRLQHAVARHWARMLLGIMRVRVTVTGGENLTPGAAYVFCSNHLSLIDTPLIFGYLPWDFRVLARYGLWKIPFLGWHLRRAGHLPVVRDDVRASVRNITEAAHRVGRGMSVVVFPEGGRSPDGELQEFKAGAAYIAIKAGVPLVPICLIGTDRVHAIGSPVVRPGHVELHLGRPIPTATATNRDARALMSQARRQVQGMRDSRARLKKETACPP
jgi:1-acyl-sn-glycerol-3-phosphate acyltransferase